MKALRENLVRRWVLAAALGGASLSHAATVLHIEGRAFLQNALSSTQLARGTELPQRAHLVVDGRVQFEIGPSTYLEIRGPARASLHSGVFWTFESGRFLVFTRGLSPHRFRVLNETFRPDEVALEVEIPTTRDYAQLLALWGSMSVQGQSLEPGQMFVLESGRVHTNAFAESEALKRREAYGFSEHLFRSLDEEESALSLRNQLVFAQMSSLNRVVADDNAFAPSNTLAFGVRVEWIHKRYFRFPRKPTRLHFLREPALRLGGGVHFSSLSPEVAGGGSQIFGAHGVLGLSWLGLALDAVAAYQKPPSDTTRELSPLHPSVRATYEWDLQEFTANDMMFALGYSYGLAPFASPTNVTWISHTLHASFHFNF